MDGEPLWVPGVEHSHPAYLASMTNAAVLTDPRVSSFANYIKSPEVYLCPSDRRVTYFLADTVAQRKARPPRNRSYSLNLYAGAIPEEAFYLSTNAIVFEKSSDFSRGSPSDIFLFQDVNPGNICMPAFIVRIPGRVGDNFQGFFHFPASHHNRSGDISFADGHVENRRWRDPTTFQEPAPAGFVIHFGHSDANTDFAWLRTKTSVPRQ